MGPAYTQVWNSPFSPHGSICGENSDSSCSSNSLPTNSGARRLGSTQVSFARKPDWIIERASSCVGIPHTGKIDSNPESFFAICPNIGQEEIAKGDAFDSGLNGGFACFLHD